MSFKTVNMLVVSIRNGKRRGRTSGGDHFELRRRYRFSTMTSTSSAYCSLLVTEFYTLTSYPGKRGRTLFTVILAKSGG